MDEVIFGDPFFYHIIHYFSPKDLYNLIQTCKFYREFITFNYFEQQIIVEINRRLYEIFGDDLSGFKKMLKETKSVISGSFIIQCALEEYWENSDIDIYIPMIGNNITRTPNRNPKSDLEDFLHAKLAWCSWEAANRYGSDINSDIEFIREYKKENGKYKIQTILVKIDKGFDVLNNFIKNNFDFDMCKNMYYFDGKDNISINNINEMLSRRTNFKTTRRLGSNILRCKKYMERGIVFDNKKDLSYETLANNSYNKHIRGYDTVVFKVRPTGETLNRKMQCVNSMDKEYGPVYDQPGIVYTLISGDVSLIKRTPNYDRVILDTTPYDIEIKNENTLILYAHTYNKSIKCDEKCVVNFCQDNVKHVHYQGENLLDAYTNLIFVIVDE